MSDKNHTEEEIRENENKRLEIADKLLQEHPYVVETWYSEVGREITADFKSANPDIDSLEMLLGLERWTTILKNEKDNGNGLIIAVGWDLKDEYHALTRDGEEVPFSEWAEDYDWPVAEYERTIEEVLNEAGWSKE